MMHAAAVRTRGINSNLGTVRSRSSPQEDLAGYLSVEAAEVYPSQRQEGALSSTACIGRGSSVVLILLL
uniref:Uncharacterized protein n=1 Tax=Arundo donax TaxID=35708 RepID=A0A0A9CFU2_ARUDO